MAPWDRKKVDQAFLRFHRAGSPYQLPYSNHSIEVYLLFKGFRELQGVSYDKKQAQST